MAAMLASAKTMRESYTLFHLQNGERTRAGRATGLSRRELWSGVLGWRGDDIHILFFFVILVFLFASPRGFASGQTQSVPSSEIRKYSEQASKALRDNQLDVAAHAYLAILQIDPTNVDARANLGVVAMSKGNRAAAADEFRSALKLQPDLWKAKALLGMCEQNLGDAQEAKRLFSESFPNLQDSHLRITIGLQLLDFWRQDGELQKAVLVMSQMEELDPTNIDVLYAAYRVHSQLAAQAIDSLAEVSPDSVQLHRALAERLVSQGQLAAAIAEYKKALQKGASSPALHYELGKTLLAYSHLESSLAEAQNEFKSALALNPTDGESECRLGQIELWRSSPQKAYEHYARASKVNPESVCADLGLAGILTDQGRGSEALKYLESAVRLDPFNSEAHHRLGMLYRQMGRKEDADRELKAFENLQGVQNQLQKALQVTASSE
jgi:tetratricopeptide (TPR) repeat protein